MPPYRYEPRDDRYAGTIGELIARRGDIEAQRAMQVANAQAQAAQARGQIWGQTLGSIGDMVAGGLQGYARDKAEAPARQIEADTKLAALDKTEAETGEIRRKGDEAERLTRRETAWTGLFDMDGLSPEVLQRETLRIYGPKDGVTMLGGLKAMADLQKGEVTDARDTALRLVLAYKHGSPAFQAQVWPQIREAVIKGKLGKPESVPEAPPDKTYLDSIEAWARGQEPEPKLHNVPAGASVLDPANPQAGAVFTAPGAERPEPNPTEATLAVAAAAGDTNAAEALRLLRQQNAGSGGRAPYFMPVQTAQGVIPFNSRTGQFEDAGRRDLKPGETAQREIANAQTTATILDQVIGSLDESKVGPIIGRYKTAQAMLTGGDPQFAAFSAAVSTLQNTVINLRTGAQMSEPEARRILNEISNVNLPPDTFIAKAKQGQKYFNEWLKNRASVAYGRTTTGDVDRMVAPNAADPTDALLDELLHGGR